MGAAGIMLSLLADPALRARLGVKGPTLLTVEPIAIRRARIEPLLDARGISRGWGLFGQDRLALEACAEMLQVAQREAKLHHARVGLERAWIEVEERWILLEGDELLAYLRQRALFFAKQALRDATPSAEERVADEVLDLVGRDPWPRIDRCLDAGLYEPEADFVAADYLPDGEEIHDNSATRAQLLADLLEVKKSPGDLRYVAAFLELGASSTKDVERLLGLGRGHGYVVAGRLRAKVEKLQKRRTG